MRGIRVAREPVGFELGACKAVLKKVVMLPFVRWAARRFARAGLAAPRAFFGMALLNPRDPARMLRRALARLPDGVSEVALHLAAVDVLPDEVPYVRGWARTFQALLAMDVQKELSAQGLEVATFKALWPQ
ncbi:MAG: hypothetical protein FJ288_20285 [Planctomycetes bacterium]|nr:hypothetical protein [Planctomycetota bacterium]